jgi:hypothetical protein
MGRTRVAMSACLAVSVLAAAPVDAATRPTIALVRAKPVQVRASGFAPHEAVRVTVRADNMSHMTATTDRDGGFDARVRGAVVSRCHALVITATGADGSDAILRRRPQCPVVHRAEAGAVPGRR